MSPAPDFNNVPFTLGDSPLLSRFATLYARSPSSVAIRTAEAELLRALCVDSPALDLCCGDGVFASLIRSSGFEAGCDISGTALIKAAQQSILGVPVCADISVSIPYPDGHFRTIVSNSSLEHIAEIDAALAEIARILAPGGTLYATFASNLAYKWWLGGKKSLKRYLEFQPVYNCFELSEWKRRLRQAGLVVRFHQYYFSKSATQWLFLLDYHVSHVLMTRDRTLARPLVKSMRKLPVKALTRIWLILFAHMRILADPVGGGILIIAEREALT